MERDYGTCSRHSRTRAACAFVQAGFDPHRCNPQGTNRCFFRRELLRGARHQRGTYFKLKAQGLGPAEMRLGSRIFITHESAARWRTVREAATAAATEKASVTA